MAQTPDINLASFRPDLPSLKSDDFDKAIALYKSYLVAGFSPQEASAVALTPVQHKWQIVASTPSLQDDKGEYKKFSDEFDNGIQSFQKNYNSYNRDNGATAAAYSLNPLEAKWSVANNLPDIDKNQVALHNNVMQQVQSALGELDDPTSDPLKVQAKYPLLLQSPDPSAAMFREVIKSKINRADLQASKNPPPAIPSGVTDSLFRLGLKNSDGGTNATQALNNFSNYVSQANSVLGKSASPANAGTPSAIDILSLIHPSWSADVLKLAAQGKLAGAKVGNSDYQQGAVYSSQNGALKFLGGDPNDPASWANAGTQSQAQPSAPQPAAAQ